MNDEQGGSVGKVGDTEEAEALEQLDRSAGTLVESMTLVY